MLQFRNITALLALVIVFYSCQEKDYSNLIQDGSYQFAAQDQLTEIIIHDIFSPPVASRIYAYPSIAAYEVAVLAGDDYQSLMGQLNGFEKADFDIPEDVYFPLAALAAYYKVGTLLIFSEELMNEHKESFYKSLKINGLPDRVFEASLILGEQVADHVIAYSKTDNYAQSRSFEKYSLTDNPNAWQPTPPMYMEGLEPHWNKIRPFVMERPDQFKSLPPTTFSTEVGSDFYREAEEVFSTVRNLTKEQSDIAYFWDCNPYKVNVKGHVMFAEKKITPGGHWMGIAAIASKTAKQDWRAAAETLAMTSIALFDGFIACWDEKYRSVLIRPETYINKYIDEEWLPVLQTPPFPEYTSGHSVVSNAAAETLTWLLGDGFHFVDSTEVAFGLPIREFESFRLAADEAAISRLYGGIHYMPAIVHGSTKGKKLGEYLVQKVQSRKEKIAVK
ncbi:vanadium-dependent haloperoxidase [Belliella kenyensis]|uniref:Vanadium-dependent haloperoxidase n=1 Tax=Belliella kenyensis TaxID=1472724 RepID=A0ABV8EM83_9BACT|nr:vanadium-dependent haloperoxidase [Belliella kenyensis]MCH7403737.1 vanadium-dependent haloperoxidase [Belliella kenyensis]MDN3602473.1 vanadium-dependent haloperoxidase [Belliella kenyensis]